MTFESVDEILQCEIQVKDSRQYRAIGSFMLCFKLFCTQVSSNSILSLVVKGLYIMPNKISDIFF